MPEKMPSHPSKSRYRGAVYAKHHHEGEIEIDDNAQVNLSGDGGAYVQAWIWVPTEDAKEASPLPERPSRKN